jgi:hypothetical protein
MEINPNHQWPAGTELEKKIWVDNSIKPTCFLDELGIKYNCDKANIQKFDRTGELIPGHNYTEVYNTLFSELKNKNINLLEIGMGVAPNNGNSLRLWMEYFPNANIYIIDNNSNNFNCNFYVDNRRVKFNIVDQSNENDLKNFVEKFIPNSFDIIIDDGSHIASHQYLTLKYFFNSLLRDGGIYVIEDLHDCEYINYVQSIIKHLNAGHLLNSDNRSNELKIQSLHFYRSLLYMVKGNKITR